MSVAEREDLPALIRRRAEREPEEPALFFRGPRGHFTWWSWARVSVEIGILAASNRRSTEGEGEAPKELLRAALEIGPDPAQTLAAQLLERLGPGSERDIWISSRPLGMPAERALLVAALLGGWAIVREPVSPLPPSTFAWARPTILSGAAEELERLLDGFAALAPHWAASRWRRRRLARLRAVVVDAAQGAERVGVRLDGLGAACGVIPLSSPSSEERAVVEPETEGEPR